MKIRELAPYQERVVDEKKELDAKIDALGAFFGTSRFAVLDTDERQRMLNQYHYMRCYSTVLGERIAHFTNTSHI